MVKYLFGMVFVDDFTLLKGIPNFNNVLNHQNDWKNERCLKTGGYLFHKNSQQESMKQKSYLRG